MAFRNKNMSVIAYANGFTMWQYVSSEDNFKDITENVGYFNPIYTLINTGDIVIVNGKDVSGIRFVEMVGNDVWLRELR